MTGAPKPFRKVLIANRGEIAVRILRACRDLEIAAVAVFSDVDRASLHVRMADEAYSIGPAPSRESYLRVDKLMDIARRVLAAMRCIPVTDSSLKILRCRPRVWTPESHLLARQPRPLKSSEQKQQRGSLPTMLACPWSPAFASPLSTSEDAQRIAREIGYPILLKAVAGGGGKGMRTVATPEDLPAAWRDAGSEALNAFGDARVYLERYLEPSAAHRGTVLRRRTWKRRLSRRAGMFGAAPPPKSRRGSAVAVRHA